MQREPGQGDKTGLNESQICSVSLMPRLPAEDTGSGMESSPSQRPCRAAYELPANQMRQDTSVLLARYVLA